MLAFVEMVEFLKQRAVCGRQYLTNHWHQYRNRILIRPRACYLAIPLYICGFVVLGASLQKHLGVGALVMGWGIAELSIMINTVAVFAYLSDCFPKHQVGPF